MNRANEFRRLALSVVELSIRRTLEETGVPAPSNVVSLLLTDDNGIRELNRAFRGVDLPTDTLAFPSDEQDILGDIAMSLETAVRQATQRGHSAALELTTLSVHSCLHLLGYDHHVASDAEAMQIAQDRLVAAIASDPAWSVSERRLNELSSSWSTERCY